MEQFEQISIFDMLYEDFKITNKIRLIELFAGYGSQNLALKYLNANYEHYKICEWATKSIQAYNDLHIQDYTDYSKELTQEEVVNFLYNRGISFDYNLPMNLKQINSRGEKWQRTTYNNIIATNNLVNIQKTHAKDLEIVETNKYTYLLTYSFPCQDLSLAGDKKGMEKGSGTRSGMLWEVERILKECDELPQVLLMENVPQVHSQENVDNFKLWIRELEKLGYSNYWQDLNAKDYGIPQNRNRTFMVSILGQYNYKFPPKQKLKLRLKDMLESEVDESYYLSKEKIEAISHWKSQQDPLKDIEYEKKICPTLTARGAGEEHAGMVLINEKVMKVGNYSPSGHNAASIVDTNGIAPTVMENHGTITAIPIKNATKEGYLLAEEGDGIDINSRMEYHRGTVQKGMAQTLKANGVDVGVVVKDGNLKQELCNKLIEESKVEEYEVIRHSYSKSRLNGEMKDIKEKDISPTLDTRCDCLGVAVPQKYNLRIRKLTPKECFRLMGLKDNNIDKIAKNQSNASQYHLAGDSIVVNVLMAIFKGML